MHADRYFVLGVMSGTSLDGVDIVYVKLFKTEGIWSYSLVKAETFSYTDEWVQELTDAIHFSEEDLSSLNERYTFLLADYIRKFIDKYAIQKLDAVCSHGHTILHQPDKGFTLQIGNLPVISEILNQTVVCDFRVQDVELKGQGAPLVPIGDKVLFSDYDYCLNLGGFSNISFDDNGKRIAYDISPVNTVLNFYAEKLGFPYDDRGNLAQKGTLNKELLKELNALEFYEQSYPKSLGKEFVNQFVFPLLESYDINAEDVLKTFTEHIAFQIADNVKENSNVLVTGGGAYNSFLIRNLQKNKPDVKWVVPEDSLVQFKEALLFALLGVLRLRNEVNVLASVTGALHDHSSGKIWLPK
ncbi:anhydro-N-acetylmuramic acid kinase [Flavobacterium sediminis]|uniref:Anhydro-N-acetylmuramic acid kinase n=1 Tax=Flavobacterium sediminis TaxID=2201181 RepID=A0A2U8QSR9_9FLAO|nr:anhydro-N-acetylmuramic acid kinase [Flavobacterium sediminis]AWM13188.1 anhydro-N-acetylmuramic acid kinase [Flavobacterium sediminis]